MVSESSDRAGYGVKSTKDIEAMEKTQPLSDHRLAIDAVIAIWSLLYVLTFLSLLVLYLCLFGRTY